MYSYPSLRVGLRIELHFRLEFSQNRTQKLSFIPGKHENFFLPMDEFLILSTQMPKRVESKRKI